MEQELDTYYLSKILLLMECYAINYWCNSIVICSRVLFLYGCPPFHNPYTVMDFSSPKTPCFFPQSKDFTEGAVPMSEASRSWSQPLPHPPSSHTGTQMQFSKMTVNRTVRQPFTQSSRPGLPQSPVWSGRRRG